MKSIYFEYGVYLWMFSLIVLGIVTVLFAVLTNGMFYHAENMGDDLKFLLFLMGSGLGVFCFGLASKWIIEDHERRIFK